MKVTSAPSVSACFEHIITMHKPEQATPHIIAKPIHVLLPPYAVNEKHQKHNMNQLLINHQANMTCLIIATTLLFLLNVPSTYANQNETSSYSEDISINENSMDNVSPTINNLLVGFDCQNPTEVDSFELESVEQCEERIQNSKTKEAFVQILQESDEYPLTAHVCKLTRTKKFHFVGLLIMILHCTIRVLLTEKQELMFTIANKSTGIDMYGRIIIEHQLNLTRTLIYQCIPREKISSLSMEWKPTEMQK